jgi:SAM-dependent methyltransferase
LTPTRTAGTAARSASDDAATTDSQQPSAAYESARCPTCLATRWQVTWENPVDYEYAVVPARKFRFLTCDECGSEWLDPRPDGPELISFYPPGYHAYHDDHGRVASALVAMRARLRARQYRTLLPASEGWLFDVGAGDCRHFAELGRLGFSFAGVEINAAMAERARQQGYDVESGTLEEMDLTRHLGRYDIVSMNHVLEHVLDPREVVRRAWSILKPGGHLIGQLPTRTSWEYPFFGSTWAGYHYPRHTQIFSRPALVRLFEDAGFIGVRLKSAPHVQTALSTQNWLVSRGAGSTLRFGRARYFGALLMLSLPIELVAAFRDRSGVIDFTAQRPPSSGAATGSGRGA